MSNLRIIKRRIKSTKNIGQITKAMQMVAASKMKKAQNLALSGKSYAEKIMETVRSLAIRTDPKLHCLLLKQEDIKSYLVVMLSTNKGLCGNLNMNLFRFAHNFIKKHSALNIRFDFVTLGQKGQGFIVKMGGEYLADFSDLVPFTQAVGPITKIVTEGYLKKKYGRVYLIYNDFINSLKQKPVAKRILPLSLPEDTEEEDERIHLKKEGKILYEPSPKEILDDLLPFYLETQIRRSILEAEASEHSARMIAMKNATENATTLIEVFTLEFNKIRQQAITMEIADITTAKISME